MGEYFKLVNHVLKQRVEPGQIGQQGVKSDAVMFGDTPAILAFLHVWKRECDWRIVGDQGPHAGEYDRAAEHDQDYDNVTETVVAEYNERFQDTKGVKLIMCGPDEWVYKKKRAGR